MSPGQSGNLIGLYLESRQCHLRVAVHASRADVSAPPGGRSAHLSAQRATRLCSEQSARSAASGKPLRRAPYPPFGVFFVRSFSELELPEKDEYGRLQLRGGRRLCSVTEPLARDGLSSRVLIGLGALLNRGPSR